MRFSCLTGQACINQVGFSSCSVSSNFHGEPRSTLNLPCTTFICYLQILHCRYAAKSSGCAFWMQEIYLGVRAYWALPLPVCKKTCGRGGLRSKDPPASTLRCLCVLKGQATSLLTISKPLLWTSRQTREDSQIWYMGILPCAKHMFINGHSAFFTLEEVGSVCLLQEAGHLPFVCSSWLSGSSKDHSRLMVPAQKVPCLFLIGK